MTLRIAIKEKHDQAERHAFTRSLLSKNMSREAYGSFLFNQLFCYDALEEAADRFNLFEGIESVRRTDAIYEDFNEIGSEGHLFPSSIEYASYVETLPAHRLMAHIYVRHMADMYGGQIIKQFVPTSGKAYNFENRAELIAKIRERLSDDMADEANVCFDYAIRLMDEIAGKYDLSKAG